jgi:hypothetical protein
MIDVTNPENFTIAFVSARFKETLHNSVARMLVVGTV